MGRLAPFDRLRAKDAAAGPEPAEGIDPTSIFSPYPSTIPPWINVSEENIFLTRFPCTSPLIPEGEVFFITIGCAKRWTAQLTNDPVWKSILETLLLREERGEICIRLILAMPDHLHGLFSFPGSKPMKQVIRDFKSWISFNHDIEWERGFFDHRIRNWESGFQKGEYIRDNPVRAGLIENRDDWKSIYAR